MAGGGLEIRLLGPFQVLRDGQPVPEHQVGSRKGRTLLKLLLLESGRVVSVDRLAEAVWPRAAPQPAERHVATLVSRLRKVIGADAIVRAGGGYRFVPGPAYAIDVDQAATLTGTAEARLAAGEPARAATAAGQALALLDRGELLADEPDAQWAAPARARVTGLRRRARRCAWTAALALDDPQTALRVAEAAVAAEPLDEAATRAVMSAHQRRGEPGLALAAYERLRRTLADELGVDPATQTRQLHLAILRAEPPAASPSPPAAVASVAATAPTAAQPGFVGREAELAAGTAAWSRAAAGHASLLVLVGEAGVGKTTLAAEVVRVAESTGGQVARSRCYEAERSLFLQPVADALRTPVLAADPARWRELGEPALASLVDLVPELATVVPTVVPPPAGPELERRRAFEAVAAVVRILAGRQPLLIVLDDLHLAGASVLELLHFLLRRCAGSRLLVLITVRVEEGQDALDTLREVGTRLDLAPLPAAAVAELARRGGVPELAGQIMARTRGHPLFVAETLRAMTGPTAGAGLGPAIPDSLRTAVLARVRRAGAEVEELLRGAATLGTSFEPVGLAGLLEQPVEELARRVAAAGRARLVVEAGAGYEFANDLVREIIYETTPLPIRIARHRRAAVLLSDRPETAAGHASRAGDWSQAMAAWLRAAAAAGDRFANRDAERLLDQALAAAVRADDQVGLARCRLARGRVREVLADYQGAYEDHLAVVGLARIHGRPDLELAALRQLGGDVPVGLGRPARECIPYLDSALALAEATGDLAAQVDILARLAVIWTNRLRLDLAHGYARRAMALAKPLGDEAVRAVARDGMKTVLAYAGDVAALALHLPGLATTLRRHRDPRRLQWTELESAFPPLAGGHWAEAAAGVARAMAVSNESGHLAYQAPFLAHLTWIERARGNYGAALRAGRRAVAAAGGTGHPWWVALAEVMLGWTLTELGELDEAARRLRRAWETAQRDATESYLLRCAGHLAWVSHLRGEAPRAAALLARVETLQGGATGPLLLHGAHAMLAAATVRVARGELGPARRLVGPVREAATTAGWVELRAWAELLAARCHRLAGDDEAAAALATAALGTAEVAPEAPGSEALGSEAPGSEAPSSALPGLAWQAHGLLADLAGARGDPEPAAAHLAARETIIDRLAGSLPNRRLRESYRAWTTAFTERR